jgi:hypothetical protein
MIITMQPGASEEQVQNVITAIEDQGLSTS